MGTHQDDHINQIRKIVLGDEIQSSHNKIKKIETSLNSKLDKLKKNLELTETELLNDIDSMIKEQSNEQETYTQQRYEQLRQDHHELIYRKFEHSKGYIKTLRGEFNNFQKIQNEKLNKLKIEIKAMRSQQDKFITKEEMAELFSNSSLFFKDKK